MKTVRKCPSKRSDSLLVGSLDSTSAVVSLSMIKLRVIVSASFAFFWFRETLAQGQTSGVPTLHELIELKWTMKGNRYSSTPLVNDGLVFETFVLDYAYEALSGEKLYFDNVNHQKAIRNLTDDSLVFFSSRGGQALVNIYNGKQIFKSDIRIRNPWISKPRIVNDSILFSAINDSTFSAIGIYSGETLWKRHLKNIYNVPIRVNETLYVSAGDSLYKLDVRTGRELRKMEIGEFVTDPKLVGEVLCVWVKGRGLVAYDLQLDSIRWEHGDNMDAEREIVSQDSLIFTNGSFLASYQLVNGALIWENNQYSPTDGFVLAETNNYLIGYRRLDDYACLAASKKENGELSFECFTNIFDDLQNPKPARPLSQMDGLLFRFGNQMYNNLIYAVDQNGDIYCFQVNEL